LNGPADHIPVLVDEVVGAVVLREGGIFLDGTVGLGGTSAAILDAAGPDAKLLGVDLDPTCVALAGRRLARFGDRALVLCGDFAHLGFLAGSHGRLPADGIVLDLGLSSWLLEASGRGFSFQRDEPLDMRFDPDGERRAEDVLNLESLQSLTKMLREFGQEPLAARIARAIVARRERSPLVTTGDLRELVVEMMPRGRVEKTLARVFQTFRIFVNRELDKLRSALPEMVEMLRPGGRLAVIGYHSLEHRVVKDVFRRLSGQCICPPDLPVCGCHPIRKLRVVEGAVRPGEVEVARNPRARSAVLRVVERVPDGEEESWDVRARGV